MGVLGLVHGLVPVVTVSTLCFGVMDRMPPAAWAMCLNLGGSCGFGIAAVVLVSAMLFSRVDCSRGLNPREGVPRAQRRDEPAKETADLSTTLPRISC
jgi:hypothetical protein